MKPYCRNPQVLYITRKTALPGKYATGFPDGSDALLEAPSFNPVWHPILADRMPDEHLRPDGRKSILVHTA